MHLPFILAALVAGVLGGFALAIALPVGAAIEGGVPGWWPAHAQVHGHLQTVGFVGLFIFGMAYRLLPRFAGGSLFASRLVPVSFTLLAAGLLLRFLGQPMADRPPFAAAMALGAWLELAAALCFLVVIAGPSRHVLRARRPFAALFVGGAAWFTVQAALGAWWLTEMAAEGRTVLPYTEDRVLVFLQFFGFHLPFILGVGSRSFPIFFGAREMSPRSGLVVAVLLHTSIAAWVLAALEVISGDAGVRLEHLAAIALGLTLVGTTALFRWWRNPSRLRPASRPAAIPVQAALAWLAVASLWLAASSAMRFLEGQPASFAVHDAVRHVIAVGVVMMAIIGVSQLVLPEFASERLARPATPWRGPGFALALSLAVVARAGARFMSPPLPAVGTYWLMAIGGLLALAVVLTFAFLYGRGVYRHQEVVATAAAAAMAARQRRRSA